MCRGLRFSGRIFLPIGGAVRQAREVDPAYRRTVVTYDTREAPGRIVVDPTNHFLYAVQRGGDEPAGQDPSKANGLRYHHSDALFAPKCQSFLDNVMAGFGLS